MMKPLNIIAFCIILFSLVFSENMSAQNNSSALSTEHFGAMDKRFLWGVSGGVSLPFDIPKNTFVDEHLTAGYQFGLDFRHRIGYENYSTYFVFLHYGVKMGSFFYKSSVVNWGNENSWESSRGFYANNDPRFLHLDIPIGVEFPLYFLCKNRLSFYFHTDFTSRFYFFWPSRVYNFATTNGLVARFDKIQLQASYSYFFLSQFSKQSFPEYSFYRISELEIALKFYF